MFSLTCLETSGENSWNAFDSKFELFELLIIADCNDVMVAPLLIGLWPKFFDNPLL